MIRKIYVNVRVCKDIKEKTRQKEKEREIGGGTEQVGSVIRGRKGKAHNIYIFYFLSISE
jgi:hypothetical protein